MAFDLRFVFLGALATIAVGCGATDRCKGSFCDDQDGAGPTDDGSAGDDVIIGGGDAGTNDGNGCARKCSGDFHTVLDCNDTIVETCMGSDGCDGKLGICANACQAAVNNKQSVGCEYYATHMH